MIRKILYGGINKFGNGLGTVTPVAYNVIYDESGLKPDHLQRLSYKLCHLYYNWQVKFFIFVPLGNVRIGIGIHFIYTF